MRIVTALTVLALWGAGSLSARMRRQQGPSPAQRGGTGMAGMTMGALASLRPFEPALLIDQAERLGLDGEQIARLTVLKEVGAQRLEDAHPPARAATLGVRRELAQETPDTATVRQLLTAHTIAMGNMQWARLEAALQGRAVLTDEQQAKVHEAIADSSGGMQHRDRGGREQR